MLRRRVPSRPASPPAPLPAARLATPGWRTAWARGALALAAVLAFGAALFACTSPAMAQGQAGTDAAAPSRPLSLHFFSPDWRPADLGALAAAFEAALLEAGLPVTFQGFTRYEDFERQAAATPPDFVLAPAWTQTSRLFASCPDRAVLARGVRNGRTTYRKALMSRTDIDAVADLAHGTIAATVRSIGDGSPAAVLAAFHLAPDWAKVVPVPKDVDALLALSFSQVDAALVTSAQYEALAARSPAEAESLRVLAFSPDVPMPQVFSCGLVDPSIAARVAERLASLRGSTEGLRALGLLGFDSFARETTAPATPASPAPAPAAAAAPRAAR